MHSVMMLCQALRDNGIEYRDEYVFWRDYTENNGYEAAKQVFFMEERPTAIVASNDLQAIGFGKPAKITESRYLRRLNSAAWIIWILVILSRCLP